MKNDRERIAFLEDYTNTENGWYLWKEDEDLQRRWWRYDFPQCALIVEEEKTTYHWPDDHISYAVRQWYIIKDWNGLFADQKGSRTLALREVKDGALDMHQPG